MTTINERIEELSDYLVGQAEENDELGRLPDETAKKLKELGVAKMLQPKEYGGTESSPVEFFDAVLRIGALAGSAGWVAGVVGVHPFELAQADRRVQDELWGPESPEGPDTWIASPYAPMGRAKKVDGGYIFNGRWMFSSGTDHCTWVTIGGIIVDDEGRPDGDNAERHFILPREDYEIVQDSWHVVGLKGTGSKDLIVKDAFVPDYRVINIRDLETGEGARRAGRGDVALYRMPFHVMFGTVITAGTLALADGALAAYLAHTRTRVTARGVNMSTDQGSLSVLATASADIDAGRLQYLHDINRMWELAQADQEIPLALRAEVRRNQVRAVRRSMAAVSDLIQAAGGGAMRLDQPLQRFWRDMSTARGHASNSGEAHYANAGLLTFGQTLAPRTRL